MSNQTIKDPKGNGRWSKLEHQRFLLGLQLYGKNWKKIQQLIGTRTGSQIRSHAQKFFLKNKGHTEDHNLTEGMQEEVHENNQSSDSMAVIKINSKKLESNQQYSCFMKQIIKATLEHKNFNFWDEFIDINCCKTENQSLSEDSLVRKGSFVVFDMCNDSKQETASPCLSIIG